MKTKAVVKKTKEKWECSGLESKKKKFPCSLGPESPAPLAFLDWTIVGAMTETERILGELVEMLSMTNLSLNE